MMIRVGILIVVIAGGLSVRAEDAVKQALDDLLRVRAEIMQTQQRERTQTAQSAGLALTPWSCTGPFRDGEFGLFSRVFATSFLPETEALRIGRSLLNLDATFNQGTLRWSTHPEWVDGYYHLLPVSPPPARNEAVYLYRTITAKQPVSVTAEIIAEDAIRVWLNGEMAGEAYVRPGFGRSKRFLQVPLHLQVGENRLLVKIASMFSNHGFAFTIPVFTEAPTNSFVPNDGGSYTLPHFERDRFYPGHEPYASAPTPATPGNTTPPLWYVKQATWQETMQASLNNFYALNDSAFVPYTSEVLTRDSAPQKIKVDVSEVQDLWLVCTIGGDDYGYDDSIWGDPCLVDADDARTSLTEIEPEFAEVGYNTLHRNQNYAGKPLQIGERIFQHGFWAHAPSVMHFHLGGRYRFFETWIGIDTNADQPGSVEFKVLDRPDPQQVLEKIRPVLVHDFTDDDSQRQMFWEWEDRIWNHIWETGDHSLLSKSYRTACLQLLPHSKVIDNKLQAMAREPALIREVYYGLRYWHEALKEVRNFHTDIPHAPLYDPPEMTIQKALDTGNPPSPGALTYLEAQARLKPTLDRALECAESGFPNAFQVLTETRKAISTFWDEQIRNLPPIVFVSSPPLSVNAVSPYLAIPTSPGCKLCVFDPAHPELPPREIFSDPEGTIFDFSLSYDAQTIFFSYLRPGLENPQEGYHLYSMGIDGTGLRQLTNGPSFDVSPVQLPNGEIMYVSTRAHNYLVCQGFRAGALYVMDRDGGNIRRVSANTLSDHHPRVMNDGQILFTRWDYGVDKGVFMRHGLWTMRPDGSNLKLYYGNTIEDPNAFWQATPIPGRPEVVCTLGPHHQYHAGMIGLLWNRYGVEAPRGRGFRWITREMPTYYDKTFPNGYQQPYPVNERLFLVSYGGDSPERNRIYLLDDRGNRRCIYEDSQWGCWWPQLLQPRGKPAVLAAVTANPIHENRNPDPTSTEWDHTILERDSGWGTVFLSDVYQGISPWVKRGEAKFIQIIEQVPKTRPHTGGYGWSVTPTIGRGTFYVRRLIGTVPIDADGSAYFRVPALKDISFNVLDAEGRLLHRMGSTTQIMPGEQQGCIGCHERRNTAPPIDALLPNAVRGEPLEPALPEWGNEGIVDFVKVVQPVFDRFCVSCHSGPQSKGYVDLTDDKTRYFNMAYNHLVDRGLVHYIAMNGADHAETMPKATGSLVSRIRNYIETDHSGQVLPLEARQRIYTWIDANIPYYGTYAYTNGHVQGARDRWFGLETWGEKSKVTWFTAEFLPVFQKRCVGCHAREVDVSEAWMGNDHLTVTSRVWTDTALMEQELSRDRTMGLVGPAHRINLTHPEWSLMLTAPLAREAGGLGLCRGQDGQPFVFTNDRDPDYQAMLRALRAGHAALLANPREDMPGILPGPPVIGSLFAR